MFAGVTLQQPYRQKRIRCTEPAQGRLRCEATTSIPKRKHLGLDIQNVLEYNQIVIQNVLGGTTRGERLEWARSHSETWPKH